MIFAGQLTEVLDFYHIKETQSESGYKVVNEEYYMTRKAYRAKNKETYVVDADEIFHNTELTFKFRLAPEVQETDIVVYNHQRYRITSIDSYQRGREMTIILAKINE